MGGSFINGLKKDVTITSKNTSILAMIFFGNNAYMLLCGAILAVAGIQMERLNDCCCDGLCMLTLATYSWNFILCIVLSGINLYCTLVAFQFYQELKKGREEKLPLVK